MMGFARFRATVTEFLSSTMSSQSGKLYCASYTVP